MAILVVSACSSSTSSSAPSAAASAAAPSAAAPASTGTVGRAGSLVERRGRGPDARTRQGLRPEQRRECDADVGALRRQQGDGRHPRLRLERGEPDQADQPELHRPHGDGGEDRPGARDGRRPGPDGHGPDLRPAVRERQPAHRHHRSDQVLDGAGRRQPGPQDRRHVQRPPVRRPAVRRRVGAVLQQGPVQEGQPRPRRSRRPASPRSAPTPTRSRRSVATSRATTCPATARAATSSPSAR